MTRRYVIAVLTLEPEEFVHPANAERTTGKREIETTRTGAHARQSSARPRPRRFFFAACLAVHYSWRIAFTRSTRSARCAGQRHAIATATTTANMLAPAPARSLASR